TKAVVGTGLMGVALAFKHNQIPGVEAGNTWDSVKIGNQTINFAPFGTLAPYMYLADLYKRWKEGRIQEGFITLPKVIEGLVGSTPLSSVNQLDIINRAFDELDGARQMGAEGIKRLVEELGGEFAGLANPLRQFFDFASEWEHSLRLTRDARGQGFTGQVEKQITPTNVPTKPNPTAVGPKAMAEFHPGGVTLTGGALHQLTGARFEEAPSSIQDEMDRLGFTQALTSAHLNNPRAQDLVDQQLGPLVARFGPALINSPAYQNGSDAQRTALLHDFFHGGPIIGKGGMVDVAKQLAMAQAPQTFANIAIQKVIPIPDQRAVDEMMKGRLTKLYQTT